MSCVFVISVAPEDFSVSSINPTCEGVSSFQCQKIPKGTPQTADLNTIARNRFTNCCVVKFWKYGTIPWLRIFWLSTPLPKTVPAFGDGCIVPDPRDPAYPLATAITSVEVSS